MVRRDALPYYRVMAYLTGVFLLVLTVGVVLRYGPSDDPTLSQTVAPIHGWLYMIYLFATGWLIHQRQWKPGQAILIALAGTVPFASFVAERFVVKKARTSASVR